MLPNHVPSVARAVGRESGRKSQPYFRAPKHSTTGRHAQWNAFLVVLLLWPKSGRKSRPSFPCVFKLRGRTKKARLGEQHRRPPGVEVAIKTNGKCSATATTAINLECKAVFQHGPRVSMAPKELVKKMAFNGHVFASSGNAWRPSFCAQTTPLMHEALRRTLL